MAKFLYSSLFDNGTLSAVVDNDIDRQAQAGRVAIVFVEAMKAKYGVSVPATKKAFLDFRSAHVKFASLPADERAKQDEKPVLWVPGHLLRSKCYGAMDAIAAGLTACERMADSADWVALFAPAPKPKAAPVVKPAVSLPAPTATFPAIGPAPKSAVSPASAGLDPAFGSHPMTQVEMVEALAAQLKAGLVPESIWLTLVQAHNAGQIKATPPARKLATALATADDTATF